MQYFSVLLILCLSVSSVNAISSSDSNIQSNNLTFKFTFGQMYMLQSLTQNSPLEYDRGKHYSDISINYSTQVRTNLNYFASAEITNKPHYIIGTKYSRPDFILTTGRFQQSYLKYDSDSFSMMVGRAYFLDEHKRSRFFAHPISGDGILWKIEFNGVTFKHLIQYYPSEIYEEQVFRRIMNYHELGVNIGNIRIGIGEYYVLSGEKLSIDFKRMNPLIPYSLNSHDSYSEQYENFKGDTDNSIIELSLVREFKNSILSWKLHIDEFQMDPWDRKIKNDALLLSINWHNSFSSILGVGYPGFYELVTSFANPNFGDHPGPFTEATSGGYPLFESSPGQINLVGGMLGIEISKIRDVGISIQHEKWVDITSLPPEIRHHKSALKKLPYLYDSRMLVSYQHEITRLRSSVQFQSWISNHHNISRGANISFVHKLD
jgi:hypothetical protein